LLTLDLTLALAVAVELVLTQEAVELAGQAVKA